MNTETKPYGGLYQMTVPSPKTLRPGDVVQINGPHDTYGRVLSYYSSNPAGTTYLVRGTGNKKPAFPVMHIWE